MSSISRTLKRLSSNIIQQFIGGAKADFSSRRRAAAVKPVIESLENRQLLTAVYPEIDLRGNGQSIDSGDATPSAADFTDFGNADVGGGLVTRTFTVANTGAGVLNLTAATRVKLSGANAADFTVVTQPVAAIPAVTGSSNFSIKFDPSASGVRAATVTIYSDDDDENPYTYSIQGTGTTAPKEALSSAGIAISPNSTVAAVNNNTNMGTCEASAGTITKTFTIKNVGSGILTFTATPITLTGVDAALFAISNGPANSSTLAAGASATFDVTFTPATAVGAANATVNVNSDEPTYADYKFAIKANAVNKPSIQVQGQATTINPGDTTPAVGDDTDYGSADVVTGLVSHTFTINNIGSAALNLTGTARVAITGANAGDFIVTTQPGASVAAAGSSTCVLKFDPKGSGLRTATVSISSNDTTAGLSPYTFKIQGTGTTAPVATVSGNNNGIANGSSSFAVANQTDMGSAVVSFGSITETYTIKNTGSATLTLGGTAVSVAGADAVDFTVLTQPATTLAVGASSTFQIQFVASASGARTTTVSITNNDPVIAGAFTFDIQGTGTTVSRMQLQGNATTITSGDTTPSTADDSDFGSTDVSGSAPIAKTFTINNIGSAALNLGGTAATDVLISGPAAGDFAVSTPLTNDPIAAAGSDTFIITFTPTATGPRFATVTIANDDPLAGNNPYTFVIEGTGTSNVVMAVSGNSTGITDGDLTPAVGDDTDFGSVNIGATPVTHTFTIDNSGTDALNLTGTPLILIGGTFAADFTVTADPDGSVGAAGTTTFDITFDPSGPGARDATVTILSDDASHAEFTFNITGTGVAVPIISVLGADGTLLASGNTPAVPDGTDFGSTVQTINAVTHTFTIHNGGSGAMTIGSIAFSGADAADFTVSRNPASSIEPGTDSTFDVTFLPTSAAAETATITVNTNDPNTAAYDFDVTGTGIDGGLVTVLGNGQSIANNDLIAGVFDGTDFGKVEINTGKVTRTYTITNTGTAVLTFDATTPIAMGTGTLFTLANGPAASSTLAVGASVTFDVTFDPAAAVLSTDTVVITSDDPVNPVFTIGLQGKGVLAPVIALYGNSLQISNGDDTPRTADRTDYGSLDLLSGLLSRTFTIKNIGSAVMKLTGTPKVTVGGANPGDFSVITQPASTSLIANTGSTTFVLRFNPGAVGSRSAVVSIASDDTTQNPFTFTVTGEGTSTPTMGVKGNGNAITNGSGSPVASNFTNMGGVDVANGTVTKTFSILNTGSAVLNLTGSPIVTLSGANAADFSISTQPATSALATVTGSTTFQVQFDPSAGGLRKATISIASDDPNAATYSFDIQGTGLVVPKLALTGPTGTAITSGDNTPTAGKGSDFGTLEASAGQLIRTFTITNSGSGVLRLTGSPRVALSGAGAAAYSVVAMPTARVNAGGGTTTFQVRFKPNGSTGTKVATVTITSDDPSAGSYTFGLTGVSAALPVINIQGNGNDIASGSTTIDSSTDTSFGSLDIIGASVTKTFTIQNNGSGTLNLTGTPRVAISGANASDFTVTVQPGASVAASGSATFTVKYDPTAAGVRNAVISIANSDTRKNPYTFAVQGIATSTAVMGAWGGAGPSAITDGSSTPATLNGTDFGNAAINTGTVSKTFTIKNTGSSVLSLTGSPIVLISGANASDFSVTTQPTNASVAITTGTTTFVLKFSPTATGVRTATISIPSNDPVAGSYDFVIQGTGITAPLMTVTGNSQAITKGASTASQTNWTDFGQVGTSGGTMTRTFTINNTGSAALTVNTPTLTGANAGDYSISTPPTSPIAAGGSATFVVTFTPGATGARVATVNIVNGDTNNTPYTFAISGTGTPASTIGLWGGAGPSAISNNSTSPATLNGTDFGSTDIQGTTVVKTFTVKNTGAGVLTLSGTPLVQVSGANAADFTVTVQPGASVAATTGTTTFQVRFDPSVAGARTATITLHCNDNTNGTYKFDVTGTGTTAPLMDIQGGSPAASITNGDTTPATADGTDFGNVEIALGTAAKTYTIRNTGSDALNFTGSPIVGISGADAADFSIVYVPRRSVAAGANTDFQVLFDPSSAGLKTATISIASDDTTHNPYTFKVQGTGVAQGVMQLTGNSQIIVKGDTTPALADSTSFGTVSAASGTVVHTFTISNLGSGTLNLTGTTKVAISGTNAADFTVSAVPGSNAIAASGSTTYQITFDPSATGLRTATITIATDDPNAALFTYVVSGTGG